jgi:hypothetical protein
MSLTVYTKITNTGYTNLLGSKELHLPVNTIGLRRLLTTWCADGFVSGISDIVQTSLDSVSSTHATSFPIGCLLQPSLIDVSFFSPFHMGFKSIFKTYKGVLVRMHIDTEVNVLCYFFQL